MIERIEIADGSRIDVENIIRLYQDGSGRELKARRLTGYVESLPSAVAYNSERIIGFAFCTPFAPDIVELGNIFVADSFRNQGVGAKLLKLVESRVAMRFHSIVLCNSMHYRGIPNKRPATQFYLRQGYQQIWSTGATICFAKQLCNK